MLNRHAVSWDELKMRNVRYEKNNIQIKTAFKFKVFDTKFGKGCFANENLEKNETICFLEGKEESWEEFEKRCINGLIKVDNPLQVSETKYIELYAPYVYFNHSCNPNSGIRGKNELIAIQNIMPNEEINYDYSSVSWDDRWTKIYGSWTMKCECEEKNCRKVIGDYPTIPKSQRRKYIRFGVTPNFILEKLAREERKSMPSLLSSDRRTSYCSDRRKSCHVF
jgi:hypothetical protein